MNRFLDIFTAMLLFAVGVLFSFIFVVALQIGSWFADPLRTWLAFAAGIVAALSALVVPWSRRVAARVGILALITLAVVLFLNRLPPLGTFAIDGAFIVFLGVLLFTAGLVYWRFVIIAREA